MSVASRLRDVRDRIERACASVGRDPSAVTLVAVTKTVAVGRIREAYDLGVRDFGENRLQEALPKIEALPRDVKWHFVGVLQSNKAKAVANSFHVVHTVEKLSQLVQIERARPIEGLIEVNIAREPQKAGVLPENLDKSVALVQQCVNVRFRGLMAMGQLSSDPEENRPHFRQMSELGKRFGAEWLSMGMSADLEVAIQEGSTHVRVGTAIFGERG
ncbi:MAG: YggS family pyridoxal phosphate-dependent enzyme [Fimbriimonadaceae bacterium]